MMRLGGPSVGTYALSCALISGTVSVSIAAQSPAQPALPSSATALPPPYHVPLEAESRLILATFPFPNPCAGYLYWNLLEIRVGNVSGLMSNPLAHQS